MRVGRRGRQVMLVAAVAAMMFAGPGVTALRAGQQACDCPHVGDLNADGVVDIFDLITLLNTIFNAGPMDWDPNCPNARADWNADGIPDVRDLCQLKNYVFAYGTPPTNPCVCISNPALCAPVTDPAPGTSGNSVLVESKTVYANQTGVSIGIKLINVADLQGVVVPLVARSITPGAFINLVQMNFGDRLSTGQLGMLRDRNLYSDPSGTCSPGGFHLPAYNHPQDYTFPPRTVGSSPAGFLFTASSISSDYLTPGADVTGSFVLTVNMTSTPGSFEIDTTCIDPANHLEFIKYGYDATPIVPAFTKGVITLITNNPPLAQCHDVQVTAGADCAANASIDNGSYDPDGGTVTITQTPPGPYSKGTTMVTLIVTDIGGAADTCQANVTVVDLTPPVISHPDSVNMRIGPADTGAVINYVCTASDNCPGVTETCTPPSGSFFRRGSTLVTCVATDAAGLADTVKFVVTAYSDCFDRMSDVNCDGLIDVMDVVKLIDIAFGNAAEVPCPTPK